LAFESAVDDAGVVQRVADDAILRAQQGLEKAAVGVEARWVENRILCAEKATDALLQLFVDGLGAADEADRCHSEAEFIQRLVRRLDDPGMVGEAEVVVGAEIQDLGRTPIVAHLDRRLLRARNEALLLEEPLRLQRVRLLREPLQEMLGHGVALRYERLQSISGGWGCWGASRLLSPRSTEPISRGTP
jgi:hypothetical protein